MQLNFVHSYQSILLVTYLLGCVSSATYHRFHHSIDDVGAVLDLIVDHPVQVPSDCTYTDTESCCNKMFDHVAKVLLHHHLQLTDPIFIEGDATGVYKTLFKVITQQATSTQQQQLSRMVKSGKIIEFECLIGVEVQHDPSARIGDDPESSEDDTSSDEGSNDSNDSALDIDSSAMQIEEAGPSHTATAGNNQILIEAEDDNNGFYVARRTYRKFRLLCPDPKANVHAQEVSRYRTMHPRITARCTPSSNDVLMIAPDSLIAREPKEEHFERIFRYMDLVQVSLSGTSRP